MAQLTSAASAMAASTSSASNLDLTTDDLRAIEQSVPAGAAAGARYSPDQMATLDSER